MLSNPVKEKVKQGEPSLGVALAWPAPDLAEFCGYLGFEWAFIDAEHGTIGRESCEAMVRACTLGGIVPVVRVPENNAATILGYLETGALGIIVPHVNSAADARAAVHAIRYAPLGRRGAGSSTRAARYGLTQTSSEYFARANEELLVQLLVEEVAGIRNLDEILAVPGVDVVGIGPGDLAMSMGFPGKPSHPDVHAAVLEAEAQIVDSGLALDAAVGDGAGALEAMQRGATMIAVSAASLLANAGHAFLNEVSM